MIRKERHIFTMADGFVERTGQLAILELMYDHCQRFRECEWTLPLDWDWHCRVGGKGEFVGTLPKRIAKLAHQNGSKLSDSLLSQIGSAMASYSGKSTEYDLEIVRYTDNTDWHSGDFGDEGSCYWGGNSAARASMKEDKCYALRYYQYGHGMGRAWIKDMGGYHVLWNSYGVDVQRSARVLSTLLGLSYRKVSLSNFRATTGTVWINGGSGYAIGAQDTIGELDRVDLEIDIVESDDNTSRCSDCGDYCDIDSGADVNGSFVCESCLENYCSCERCGDYQNNDDIVRVDDSYYCEYCAERIATKCDDCGEWSKNTTEVDGDSICESCLENYSFCESCDEYHKDTYEVAGNNWVCEDCRDNNYSLCAECSEWFPTDDTQEHNGEILCDDCFRAVDPDDRTPAPNQLELALS